MMSDLAKILKPSLHLWTVASMKVIKLRVCSKPDPIATIRLNHPTGEILASLEFSRIMRSI